jgi:hypothetical protein
MRLLIIALVIPYCSLAQEDWSLELEKDSIKVYTSKRADSRYKTVKAVFTVDSSLPQLAAAVLDIDNYAAWQYKTASVRVLQKISDREVVYHTEVEAPAVATNRDFVIRLTVDPDPMTKGLIIEAVSIPEFIPEVEDVIRVPYSRARWTVIPVKKGKLSVEYIIDIDLGGSVPVWLVNMLAPKAPYETFNAFRNVIGKYKGQEVQFLEK